MKPINDYQLLLNLPLLLPTPLKLDPSEANAREHTLLVLFDSFIFPVKCFFMEEKFT